MKTFIKYTIVVMILLTSMSSLAQQLPQFTQYMYNTLSVNPAYAGNRGTLSMMGLHRSQWLGFDGGPTTQTLSIHSPLRNEQIGLGFSFINDQLGYENFVYMYGDFSYTIMTGNESKLSFGIKGGFTSFSIDQELINAEPEDDLIQGLQNKWSPNVGAGLLWHAERWYIGLSAPRLFINDYTIEDGYKALERISYYFTGGYVFDAGQNVKFKPTYMVKATNGAPISVDLSANFLFNERFWLGAAYRINESAGAFGAMIDFQVTREWRIGYTYEHPMSDIRPYTNGTHEIFLMVELFKKNAPNVNRVKSPRYY
jgi:type IX secretion system PorP/SprF family membrane protein